MSTKALAGTAGAFGVLAAGTTGPAAAAPRRLRTPLPGLLPRTPPRGRLPGGGRAAAGREPGGPGADAL
ncbi:hypothetical protein [Kitasatospora sp. NBC_01539]|uniref:hypothetical protein n=1 Tax=Kitasatospora sp. NBC_01539 TaxID=2903577 RepID=UPI003860254E